MPSDATCAFCRQRPPDPDWRPFCSERCKLLDLGAWLGGHYRIAGDPVRPDDEPAEADGHSPDG